MDSALGAPASPEHINSGCLSELCRGSGQGAFVHRSRTTRVLLCTVHELPQHRASNSSKAEGIHLLCGQFRVLGLLGRGSFFGDRSVRVPERTPAAPALSCRTVTTQLRRRARRCQLHHHLRTGACWCYYSWRGRPDRWKTRRYSWRGRPGTRRTRRLETWPWRRGLGSTGIDRLGRRPWGSYPWASSYLSKPWRWPAR